MQAIRATGERGFALTASRAGAHKAGTKRMRGQTPSELDRKA